MIEVHSYTFDVRDHMSCEINFFVCKNTAYASQANAFESSQSLSA